MQGVPSIALSQFYGPALEGHDTFSAAKEFGLKAIQSILDAGQWNGDYATTYYNVNFPPCLAHDVKGQKFTAQGFRGGRFSTDPRDNGGVRIIGGPQAVASKPGTDVAENLDGFITIIPCQLDLTDHTILAKLNK